MLDVVVAEQGHRLCGGLSDRGMRVSRVRSGLSAVSAVVERSPDVVVIDGHSRGDGGLATVELLRRYAPETPIVVQARRLLPSRLRIPLQHQVDGWVSWRGNVEDVVIVALAAASGYRSAAAKPWQGVARFLAPGHRKAVDGLATGLTRRQLARWLAVGPAEVDESLDGIERILTNALATPPEIDLSGPFPVLVPQALP